MVHPNLTDTKGGTSLSTSAEIHELITYLASNFPKPISVTQFIKLSTLHYCYLYVAQQPDTELKELLQQAMTSGGISNLDHLTRLMFVAPKSDAKQSSRTIFRGKILVILTPEIHKLFKYTKKNNLKHGVINSTLEASIAHYCCLYVAKFPTLKSTQLLQEAMASIRVKDVRQLEYILYINEQRRKTKILEAIKRKSIFWK